MVSGFFGTMGISDFLLPVWFPIAFLWFGFHTPKGDNRTSAVPITYFSSTLSGPPTGVMPSCLYHNGHENVICCDIKRIDHFQPHNYFPVQSLHFRFGSVAPCPTLKPNVTMSAPRTRYGRLVRPYPTGFSCYILSAYQSFAKFLPLARENQLC